MLGRLIFAFCVLVAAGLAFVGVSTYRRQAAAVHDYQKTMIFGTQMSVADNVQPEQHAGCSFGNIPADHVFVAASVWEGGELTDLALGRADNPTRIVRVSVAPGDQPISLYLSGYSVIWEFTGDVERVQRVVLMSAGVSNYGMLAVTGMPSDRVAFPPVPEVMECLKLVSDSFAPENESRRQKALTAMFGRRPDYALYQRAAAELRLPDATFTTPAGATTRPSGLRRLDPTQIITPVPISRPETLPGAVGLVQLEASGAIRKPTEEEVETFIAGACRAYQSKLSPDYRLHLKFDYAITDDIMLPAGFTGMERKAYLVLAGVPAPRGIAGRTCIAQMDGFRLNDVATCSEPAREGIELLKRLPEPAGLAQCQLFDPPAGASLEAVAVYEPERPAPADYRAVVARMNEKPTPVPIDVHVKKAGDVALVLMTYNPAIWRVSASEGTRIVGALLIGHYTSKVEGLASGIPVVSLDRDQHDEGGSSQSALVCMLIRGASSAYKGGPDALVFDRQVQALTGRNLDGLRGAYSLKTVEVR